MTGEPAIRLEGVRRTFRGGATALEGLSTTLPAGRVTGVVGPDGAGKTTLMRLLAGLLVPDAGSLSVAGADPVTDPDAVHGRIGYMPQQFGLYEDLTVLENLRLHADLRGVTGPERQRAFERLLDFTGLGPFGGRLAGRLSGGMKQKLGLACALVERPRVLLLDEPSVGVDPLSRRELWHMVHTLAEEGIAVLWSTAYLDEAARCAGVLLLTEGVLLYDGPPDDLTRRVAGRVHAVRPGSADKRDVQARLNGQAGVVDALVQGAAVRLVVARDAEPARLDLPGDAAVESVTPRFEDAFVDLLRERESGTADTDAPLTAAPATPAHGTGPVVEVAGLVRTFGDFRAVDGVDFSVEAGEIFGLLGPNGAGKSTTFKMLCGLLPASAGDARVAGVDLRRARAAARARIGYMAQSFSLYGILSVRQNLDFFGGAYGLSRRERRARREAALDAYGLRPVAHVVADALPLGFKQRLALACALLHGPAILFLDEPTSGVDPLTRRAFWRRINARAAQGVTVLVTTHFLDEAEYCDRLGIILGGRLIARGPTEDVKARGRTPDTPDPTLEDAFVRLIEAERAGQAA